MLAVLSSVERFSSSQRLKKQWERDCHFVPFSEGPLQDSRLAEGPLYMTGILIANSSLQQYCTYVSSSRNSSNTAEICSSVETKCFLLFARFFWPTHLGETCLPFELCLPFEPCLGAFGRLFGVEVQEDSDLVEDLGVGSLNGVLISGGMT